MAETYDIYDNGSLPFRVIIDRDRFTVLRQDNLDPDTMEEDYNYTYTTPVYESTFVKLFVGEDPEDPDHSGNSLLFQVYDNDHDQAYVYVGSEILKFRPPEPITRYVSPVSSSWSPYPHAISENHVYLVAESVYAERSFMSDGELDPYDAYYDVMMLPQSRWYAYRSITLVRRLGEENFQHLHLSVLDLLRSYWYESKPPPARMVISEDDVMGMKVSIGLHDKRLRHYVLRHLVRRTLLTQALRSFLRRRAAALVIQRAWKAALSDPYRAVCRRRLLREFEEMSDEGL